MQIPQSHAQFVHSLALCVISLVEVREPSASALCLRWQAPCFGITTHFNAKITDQLHTHTKGLTYIEKRDFLVKERVAAIVCHLDTKLINYN